MQNLKMQTRLFIIGSVLYNTVTAMNYRPRPAYGKIESAVCSVNNSEIRFKTRFKDMGDRSEISVTYSKRKYTDRELPYHIHMEPVSNNNCTSTKGHYDPFGKEIDGYKCDPKKPETCYVGDLSGKTGGLKKTNGAHKYIDNNMKGISGIMKRSMVIHDVDLKRLYCCDIVSE